MDSNTSKYHQVSLKNGETINVYVSGSSKDYIVMLQGIMLDHRCLKPLFSHLEEKFTVIAPDYRGHGLSTYNTPIAGMSDLVEDLNLLIEYFGFDKVSLFGWSAGALLGLKFAGTYPDKVDKIIISGPTGAEGLPMFKPGKEKGEKILVEVKEDLRNRPSTNQMEKAIIEKDLNFLRSIASGHNFKGLEPDPEHIDLIVQGILLAKNTLDFVWCIYTCNITEEKKFITEGTGEISKIKSKVLIFYGENDSLVPFSTVNQYLEYFGDKATLKVIPNSAHAVHMSHAKVVGEEIIKFCFSTNN